MFRKLLLTLVLTIACLSMKGQYENYGLGFKFRFFPYNFYDWKEDVNKDFIVDTQDVLRIYDAINKADDSSLSADVNLDKIVDTQDVLKVYDFIQTDMNPTLVAPEETFKVIEEAVKICEDANMIVNSPLHMINMFFPVDNGLLTYIDPVSMVQSETLLWEFRYDQGVKAIVYRAERQNDGTWLKTDSLYELFGGYIPTTPVFNRLESIVRNAIVIEPLQSDKHYYKTIGNEYLYLDGEFGVEGKMTVAGGAQLDSKRPGKVIKIGDVLNGKVFLIDRAACPSYKSVSDILASHLEENGGDGEFSKFYELLQSSGSVNTIRNNTSSASRNGNLVYVSDYSSDSDKRMIEDFLNSYQYTMYIPTNEAMDEAFEKGLPTMEMLDAAYEISEDSARYIQGIMRNFVKYHIQEQALFIDQGYETGKYFSMKFNPATGTLVRLAVEKGGSDIFVEGISSPKQAVNKAKMYNVIAHEYWLNNNANRIQSSSSFVLHAIDHPLLYNYGAENNQFEKMDWIHPIYEAE